MAMMILWLCLVILGMNVLIVEAVAGRRSGVGSKHGDEDSPAAQTPGA